MRCPPGPGLTDGTKVNGRSAFAGLSGSGLRAGLVSVGRTRLRPRSPVVRVYDGGHSSGLGGDEFLGPSMMRIEPGTITGLLVTKTRDASSGL